MAETPAKILVRNTTTRIHELHFYPEGEKGSFHKKSATQEQVLVFGSSLDEGIAGATQPELELDAAEWEKAKRQPAIAHLVKSRVLREYGLRGA